MDRMVEKIVAKSLADIGDVSSAEFNLIINLARLLVMAMRKQA